MFCQCLLIWYIFLIFLLYLTIFAFSGLFLIYILKYVFVFVLCVWVFPACSKCIIHSFSSLVGPKRVSNPLEKELQMVVSLHVDWTQVFCKSTSGFNHWASFLSPWISLCLRVLYNVFWSYSSFPPHDFSDSQVLSSTHPHLFFPQAFESNLCCPNTLGCVTFSVVKGDLTLLPLPLERWDCKCAPPHPVYGVPGINGCTMVRVRGK